MDVQFSLRRLQPDSPLPAWQRLSLRYHIVGHYLLTVALILGVTWVILYYFVYKDGRQAGMEKIGQNTTIIANMVRQTTMMSLQNRLQSLMEANLVILADLNQDVLAGRMSSEEAQTQAKQTLPLTMKQIDGERPYLLTLSAGRAEQGKDNKEVPEDFGTGLHIFKSSAEMESKVGLKEAWPKPDTLHLQALFKTYFAPWDWHLSLLVQLEPSLLLSQESKILLSSFHVGTNSSLCVINTRGEMLYHSRLRGTIQEIENAEMRTAYAQALSKQTGEITATWQEPNDVEAGERYLFFRFIPEFDWIVVVIVQREAVFAPTMDFGWLIFWATLTIFAVTLLLSGYLATILVRPLTRLVTQMDAFNSTDEGPKVQADEKGLGEIGLFGQHFNRYMEKFYQANESLNREVKEKTSSEQQLVIYHKAFKNAPEGVCITDPHANVLAINRAFIEVTGYSEEDVLGRNMNIMKSDRHDKKMYVEMWRDLQNIGRWSGEIWNKRKNGEIYPEILNISAIYDDKGNITHFVGVFHDITEMKYQEEQIAHQAYHDLLTGLPNRALALDRIGVAIAHAKRNGNKLALLFLDLDNFKTVNDTYGHEAGDKLLWEAANRLKVQMREEDTVARLGGDEFLILVATAILSEDVVIHIARRILRAFSLPFFIGGQELFVTVSIGISFYPQDGDTPSLLIKYADIAMYQAKSRGKNNYHLFTADLVEHLAVSQEAENNFRQALAAKEFEVHYQPKFDLLWNRISGAEALVRWQKKDGTVIEPMEFIPLAEQTGLIMSLGEQIFNSTCLFVQQLRKEGYRDLIVSVNLSPLQFSDSKLVESILDALKKYAIPGSCLELELMENTMLSNPEKTGKSLQQLVEAGIGIALDDFGTGYSSLAYLQKLPISTLKIDNSFIRNLPGDLDSCQLVKTIIMVAKNLSIRMVAEGVETQEQIDWLRENECEQAQGYFFSKPLTAENFFAYLRQQKISH